MKWAAYGTLLSAGTIGGGAMTKAPEMLQLGALSLLGWIVWYLLVRAFPAHVKSQADERTAFLKAQSDAREDFKDSLNDLTHAIELMAVSNQSSKK